MREDKGTKDWLQTMIKELEINKIIADRSLNVRQALDDELVAIYQEVYDSLPPVSVFDTESGLILADGFHRLAAARRLKRKTVKAEVRKGSYRDAVEYAALANLKQGKNLNRTERRTVIEVMLKLHPERADNWIAEDVGASDHTVRAIREELETASQIAKLDKVWGRDGKVYPREQAQPEKAREVDLWDGKIFRGDALDILRKDIIPSGSIDLAFVDPPYFILGEEWDKQWKSKGEYLNWTRAWLGLVIEKLKPTGRLFVSFSEELMFDFPPLAKGLPILFEQTLIWNYKNNFKPHNRTGYKHLFEPVFYLRMPKSGELSFSVYGEEQGDVWNIALPQSNYTEGRYHKAQKPLELLLCIIRTASGAGDVVLDPFAGSGTTGVAAHQLGRDFRLIEIDAKNITTIRERLDHARQRL